MPFLNTCVSHRSKQAALEQRREELNERKATIQATRAKHVSLQRELQDSLSRSKERLTRLTGLDEKLSEEENYNMPWDQGKEDSYQIAEGYSEEEIIDDDSDIEESAANPGVSVKDKEFRKILEDRTNPWSTPLVRPIQDEATMTAFGSRHRKENLMSFLPCIGIGNGSERLLENILTLMVRDAAALDEETAQLRETNEGTREESSSPCISRSNHRRQALWNTCLDLLQLRRVPNEQNNDSTDKTPCNLTSEDGETRLDPNVSLCPYELAGVCADEFCPYQHVSKQSLVQRERLPLPVLRLLPLERQNQRLAKGVVEEKGKGRKTEFVLEGAHEQEEELALEQPDSEESMDEYEPAELGSENESTHGTLVVTQESSSREKGSFEDWNLDFIQLPKFSGNYNSDASDDEDDAQGIDENDIVTTYLNEVVKWNKNHCTFWWESIDASGTFGQRTDPGRALSMFSWLQSVAGFQVIESPHSHGDDRLVEYIHAVPETPLEYLKWFGRIVDSTRVAVHAGRFDVARALLQLATTVENTENWGSVWKSEGVGFSPHTVVDMLEQIVDSAFIYDDQCQSCFHSAFTCHTALAILSETVRLTHDTSMDNAHNSDVGNTGEVVEWGTVIQLIELSQHPQQSLKSLRVEHEVDIRVADNPVAGLKFELIRASQLNNLGSTNSPFDGDGPKQQQCVRVPSIKTLFGNLFWALSLMDDNSSLTTISVHRLVDEVISPCWSLVKTFLLQAIGDDQRQFDCLRATVMMGYLLLGSLERFVRQVDDGEDSFDSKPTLAAALSSADTTIHRILLEWYKLVDDVPMLELLLCPLFAASAATAAFLRHYATAQHRLEFLIGNGSSRIRNGASGDQSLVANGSIASLSEFLWSQLVHLRFSLPTSTETRHSTDDPRSPKKKRKLFEWDISKSQIEENRTIARCIVDRNIALHHVSLDGDWNLVNLMANHISQEPQTVDSEHGTLKQTVTALQQAILGGEENLAEVRQHKLLEVDLRNRAFVDRQDTKNNRVPPLFPSKPTFPRSILLAGLGLGSGHLSSLHIEECNILKLPAQFGLYFPNLTVSLYLIAYSCDSSSM